MTRKYFIISAAALIIVIIAGFWVLGKFGLNQKTQTPTASEFVDQVIDLEMQINREGSVEVVVTPVNFSGKEWLFEIAFNTHSGELTSNLIRDAVLFDNKGGKYVPFDWQGDPPGGHHRSGVLKFNPISPRPNSITLRILQVGGVEARNFTWQLK